MKQKLYILILTVSIISFAGCKKDFLENSPTNAISASDALASPDNMMLVLNGLHRMMYSQNPLDGYALGSRSGQSYFMPALDAIGGLVIHSAPGNGWHKAEAQWLTHTNETYSAVAAFWYERYHFIASVNSIINKVEDDQLVKDAKMNNILGQSHAYRAWAYHQLVSSFAKGYLISADPATQPGVPLLFATEAPYTSEGRSSVEAVYTQCLIDIDLAIEYLKLASAPNNQSHISLEAAYGIKARIALNKGDWATAASAAALARVGYPLVNEADYKKGFNTYDLDEVIWGGKVIDSESNYYQSFFYFMGANFNGTQPKSNPKLISSEIYAQIPATDYRRDMWLPTAPNTNPAASNGQGGNWTAGDPNYASSAEFIAARNAIRAQYGMGSGHHLHPYMSVKFLNKNPNTIDPDDVLYMRSSEMILIEAEGKAMLNQIGPAQDALALLGEARDSAFDKLVFNTKEKLMEQIKFQRRVELWGEGFAYHDQIRWDEGIDQTNSGASLILLNDAFIQAKPSINNGWIWKIPLREIDANPNLTSADQN